MAGGQRALCQDESATGCRHPIGLPAGGSVSMQPGERGGHPGQLFHAADLDSYRRSPLDPATELNDDSTAPAPVHPCSSIRAPQASVDRERVPTLGAAGAIGIAVMICCLCGAGWVTPVTNAAGKCLALLSALPSPDLLISLLLHIWVLIGVVIAGSPITPRGSRIQWFRERQTRRLGGHAWLRPTPANKKRPRKSDDAFAC